MLKKYLIAKNKINKFILKYINYLSFNNTTKTMFKFLSSEIQNSF